MIVWLLAINFILILLIGSYFFYSSKDGTLAVYNSWYAWIIDFLAFLSGAYICTVSSVMYLDGYSLLLITPLFFGGATQACLHVAKFFVRVTAR
ncbi:hypothetical protein CL619_04950 [archaeon]|nr:hypothetical protein [archaeon]|tara:strand:- start:1642 stop:1923 length:282 start_codon:yes stop_codon:yes gene_type:complete